MTHQSDQPMLYRFLGTDRTYGPRALDWVVRTYGGREDASAAPEALSSLPSAWRPVSEWAAGLPSASASAEQLARLTKLGVTSGGSLTYEEAEQAIARAEDRVRAAKKQKKPTALKLKRLADLGLTVPENATRGDVDALLREHELRLLGEKFSALGLRLPSDGVTDDNHYDLQDALESLDFGLKQAAERGFKYQPQYPLDADEMRSLAEVLEGFWSAAGDLDWEWDALLDEGTISLKPTASEREAVLPTLFELIQSGQWSHDSAGYAILARQATSERGSRGAR